MAFTVVVTLRSRVFGLELPNRYHILHNRHSGKKMGKKEGVLGKKSGMKSWCNSLA